MKLCTKVSLPLVMLLSCSHISLAANPFSDVPKNHWAYTSVAKLAESGVIQGYPDGTFCGNHTLTRYEMAQLVAKALAKGALGEDDQLVQEFAEELNNLGVRVTALEKKADKVTISGKFKIDYRDTTKREPHATLPGTHHHHRSYHSHLTSYLDIKGKINPHWTFNGQLKNKQKLVDDNGNCETTFAQAYLEGTYQDNIITIGRFNSTLGNGYIYDDFADGLKLAFGKDLTVTAEFGKMSNTDEPPPPPPSHPSFTEQNNVVSNDALDRSHHKSSAGKYYCLGITGKLGKFTLNGSYLKAKDVHAMGMKETTDSIWTLGACYQLAKLNVEGRYLKGNNETVKAAEGSEHGYVLGATYGEADEKKLHSFSLYGNYYDQGASTTIAHTMAGPFDHFPLEGFKGYGVGAKYIPLENIMTRLEFFELQGKKSNKKAHTIWSQLTFFF